MSRALLLELGTEDLPARYVVPLAEALSRGIGEGLTRRGVSVDGLRTYATPRRLAVTIDAVAERQPDQTLERLGPALAAAFKDGQPTPAALGFAKSCGVEFSAIGEKDGKLHFSKQQPGKPSAELIGEIFEETLKQMDELVPKRMRWGSSDETFVRPLQWICCLFGGEVVPLRRFGLDSGRSTYGHRFHAPAAITLAAPGDYIAALKNAHVWAEVATRKAEIKRQIEAQAQAAGGFARITEDLLDEVTALVEWPVAITGHFEERFLELPPEVIVATVETNQRYFTVFKDAALTQLTHAFITVSNIESRDVAQVITGNERVVRPRLSDAMFFWQQDLKTPFHDYMARLESVVYQKELGTVADKMHRVLKLANPICRSLGHATELQAIDKTYFNVVAVATTCKNDLATKMVYEFPELQGVMGSYYYDESIGLTKSERPSSVASAIREHYLPTQQGTPIPSTREGQIVALADKLDTLAGIFAIGQKPTASKDPYALRRAALGVLRIIREAKLSLRWQDLAFDAIDLQPVDETKKIAARISLSIFIEDRYRNLMIGSTLSDNAATITTEQFEAVRLQKSLLAAAAISQGDAEQAALVDAARLNDIEDFERRLSAVQTFVALPEAASLAFANKRVRNILKQAGDAGSVIDPARFEHAAEKSLFAKLEEVEAQNAGADYTQQLLNLASLRAPVDAFFDGVMVNADDAAVRANRLALLRKFDIACRSVADLSQLPG